MKTIIQIDLSSASQAAVLDLAELCITNGLTIQRVAAKPVEASPRAEKAPVPKRAAKPKRAKRVRKPAKKPAAAKAPAEPKSASKESTRRMAEPTPEEREQVLSILREHDKGEGLPMEAIYSAWGGKTDRKQAIMRHLRSTGELRDNGLERRSMRIFAPGVEHPTTGQTLRRVRPKVRVRDAVTKAPKREMEFNPEAVQESAE